jgi:hypothetical protein
MELLGFSGWTRLNEASEPTNQYLVKFPDPQLDREDRKALYYRILNEQLAKLYPNYKVDITPAGDYKDQVVFTYQDDDFGMFSDTGTTSPVTIILDHTGISVFLAIRQEMVKVIKKYANLFNTPGGNWEFVLSLTKYPLDELVRKVGLGVTGRWWSQEKEEPIPPTEDALDKLAFDKNANPVSFQEALFNYLQFLAFQEYFKAAIIGPYSTTTDSYAAEIEPKVTAALEMNFNEVDNSLIEKLTPILRDLYFHSDEKRPESKVAIPLLIKLLATIKEKSGNLAEVLEKVNKLNRLFGKNRNNSF